MGRWGSGPPDIGEFRRSGSGSWMWNVLVSVCEREKCLCLCCAFSAVLSGSGHSLPCEARRENVSHGVIMSNPPPHTRLPFSPSIVFRENSTRNFFSPLFGHKLKTRLVVFGLYRGHSVICDRVEYLMRLLSMSDDFYVYLSDFPVSVTAG